MKKWIWAAAGLVLGANAHAQDTNTEKRVLTPAEQNVLENTNVSELMRLSAQFNETYLKEQQEAREYARQHNIPLMDIHQDGSMWVLVRITETGQPVYRCTDNVNAAKTISTIKVQPNGISGLNLTGTGVPLGEWDGGSIRTTHVEFLDSTGAASRITQIDVPTSASEHATHVAGTILAKGTNASIRGMAVNARMRAFDFNNDNSEMASEAALGMIVSNHSYGIPGGFEFNNGWYWYGDINISQVEDYKFGYYDSEARDWDNLALSAPFYLMVKSAGNNRDEWTNSTHRVNVGGTWTTSTARRNSDGQFDNMTGSANSKNILVVGSVQDLVNGWTSSPLVRISSFSSTGPTDDGRIKPDIVGNGDGLNSCSNTSNTATTNMSGTSMSSPNVTGSIVLLQQLNNRLYNRYLRSATMKAVVLHTADEAGVGPGPDYSFGWGLMNTYRAAQVISDSLNRNQILEKTLANKDTFSIRVYSNGNEPLKATIVWMDQPGSVISAASALNNPALKLVNDLDLRIVDSLGNEYQPWVLNPAQRTAAATTGDNFRDNVEQVLINAPFAGWYTIRVSHKGTLRGGVNPTQPFSLVLTGANNPRVAAFHLAKREICLGQVVQFQDNSSFTARTYNWTFQGGTSSTTTLACPTVQYNTLGTFLVKLVVTDSTNSYTAEDSFYVRVNPIPVIDTIIKTNNTCNQNGSLTVNISNGVAPYRFAWTPSKPDSNVITGLGSGIYSFVVTDARGCSRNGSATVQDRGPVVSISTFTGITCFGANNGTATAVMSGGQAPFTYSWNTVPAQNTAVATGMKKGLYTVTATDSNGCTSNTQVTILEPDSITITGFSSPSTSGNNGSAGVSVSGGTMPYTYLWNTTPPSNSNSIFNQPQGVFTCTVTDAKGCVKTMVFNLSVGVVEKDIITKVGLYPNPSDGRFILHFTTSRPVNSSIQLTNSLGQVVSTRNLGKIALFSEELDFSSLAKGVYFLNLKTDGGNKVLRIVIQ